MARWKATFISKSSASQRKKNKFENTEHEQSSLQVRNTVHPQASDLIDAQSNKSKEQRTLYPRQLKEIYDLQLQRR